MARKTESVFFIQIGDSNTYRVGNGDKIYVLREDWEGKKLLNTTKEDSFANTKDGEAKANALLKKLMAT